jgi:hypothetical protein
VAALSAVVVIQTLIFLVFVAIVSTVSGLSPNPAAAHLGGCPLISTSTSSSCSAGSSGVLAEVGSGDPGDQFAKCLLAIVTVWLMLDVPRRISRGEMTTARGLRTLAVASSGAVLGGIAAGRGQLQPQVGRFGSQIAPAARSLLGRPGLRDHRLANRLEERESVGAAAWPGAPGRETREQFIGRSLLTAKDAPGELQRVLGMSSGDLSAIRDRGPTDAQVVGDLGRSYVAAGGERVHELDAAYLNALRTGRLRAVGTPPREDGR